MRTKRHGGPTSLGNGEPIDSGDLFGEIQLAALVAGSRSQAHSPPWPGLAICGVAAAAAAWLSERYGFPITLLGLLIGLSLNFAAVNPRTHRGLDLASQAGLRFGIAALGLQITFAEIGALGPKAGLALLVVMASAALFGLIGARITGQSRYVGILAGGATAICGVSAALALYGTIGKSRLSQAEFALTLVGISLASALAMSTYPALVSELGFSDRQAGFLIGASIHDVAQAIGAGYAHSDAAGGYATIVKLSRVALLAPLVALVAMTLESSEEVAVRPLWRRFIPPWFIIVFLVTVALNSLVAVPEGMRHVALVGSKALLLLAVIATAMRTRSDLLVRMGWRAPVPVMAATLASLVAALACSAILS